MGRQQQIQRDGDRTVGVTDTHSRSDLETGGTNRMSASQARKSSCQNQNFRGLQILLPEPEFAWCSSGLLANQLNDIVRGQAASAANECLEIAAFGAGAAYDELWSKSNLLVLVSYLALIRLNFVKEQLGGPVTNREPRLTH
jgi:hypothetical protein